jgi:prepilin-type N-terminal cleavage/methylation domain-containing protein
MMKKGFTLLELIVVIIILGVLATLGFTQYASMVEKMRGAEARMILGDMRKLALAYRLANGTVTGIANSNLNIGTDADQIPGPASDNCRSTHYFRYTLNSGCCTDPVVYLDAVRCTSGGKSPQGLAAGQYLTLQSNLVTGVDTWGGGAGY